MAVRTWVLAVLAAIGGAFVAPIAWGALSGLAAGAFVSADMAVPAAFTLGTGVTMLPVLALLGALAGVWLVVKD